ncbi:GNAT family N-acetyltransferase [Actinosynnema sp. NPDC020468]|uniref:GNAT family N-acetyltransferase n=1 Tax=Actinosynnema sp. NPDC020468 TaxID=3154488 RepID=UPI0033ED07DC
MGDDLVLRVAQPGDLDRIGALLTDRGTADDAVDHRLVVEDPDAGWERCAVVVDGDRVVSTLTLLDETLHLGGVEIPAGQIELVATDRAYEGRGLVRRLVAWAHELSARRGHLTQVMLGIPYFYRQFGYGYAVPISATRAVTGKPVTEGHTIRRATVADIPAMASLQAGEQERADLFMPHSAGLWRWLVERAGSTEWVVERAGVPVATGRTTPPEEGVRLCEQAAVDVDAARALLVLSEAAEVTERPDTVAGDAVEPFLAPAAEQAESYYVRVADPVALFDRLRPVFGARLRDAGFDAGEVLVSFFRSHLRMPFADGVVGPVVAGGRMQGPGAEGGAGVAPDMVAALLYGPWGMKGLQARFADVYPGPKADLMYALFPPVRADLMTFYMP